MNFMLTKHNKLLQNNYRYLSLFWLVVGPIAFVIGMLIFGYNKVISIQSAQSEWNRYKKERNNYLDFQKAKTNADLYKFNLEQSKFHEATKYFSELPTVMNSIHGMTLVNFGKIVNGEQAQYSYQSTIGQQTYNVQGTIKAEGNNLYYEDDYNKTSPEVQSGGEVLHRKNESDGTITVEFLTTKNSGNLSRLGDVKLFIFKYK